MAVLINKAMIGIPPKFAGRKPVGPIPADFASRAFSFGVRVKIAALNPERLARPGAPVRFCYILLHNRSGVTHPGYIRLFQ